MCVREIALIHVSLSNGQGRAPLEHNQYLLRTKAEDTILILTYHIIFFLSKSLFSIVHAKVIVIFLQTTIVVIMYMQHC